MPNISFVTTVWNEHEEISRLLKQIFKFIKPGDEVIVQGDQGKVTDAVISVLYPYMRNDQFKYVEYKLNRDFATYKNNLFRQCTKDYIVNIDADELLSDDFFEVIHEFLDQNSDIDLFALPRVNIVNGLTDEYVKQMNWHVNEKGWVNWPDYQRRIVKRLPGIYWEGSVHEQLKGVNTQTFLPMEEVFALVHEKQFDRQQKQNKFYEKFTT